MSVRRILIGGAAWSLVLAPLLAGVGTSSAGAMANPAPASLVPSSRSSSAFDNQDAVYAATYGVSTTVAAQRRMETEAFGQLVAAASRTHGEGNVDAWVETVADGQVFHLRSTSPVVVKALEVTVAASGLRSVVALEATSLADKTADLAATVGDIPGIDGYYVDVTTGQPVVSVPAADLASVTKAITERVPNARIESSGEGARDENRGGLNLTSCTSGFAAAWNGYKGFFTAAHCTGTQSWQAAGGTTWNWSSAVLTQVYNGTADIAFRRISSAVYNDMWIGTGFATISSGSGVAVVGTTYCGRGKTSGYRCAQVTSTTYTPTHTDACPGGCGPNFVRATLNYGSSQGGDSGGPWANGNTAVGIHKGSDGVNVHWSKIGYRPASSNVFTG